MIGFRKSMKWSALVFVLVGMLLIAACGGGNNNNGGNGGNGGGSGDGGGSGGSGGNGGGSSVVADDGPFGKYDPPIEISFVRNLSDVVENNVLGVLKDQTIEDNRWSRVYEEELGIKITYDWIVKGDTSSDQYMQRINLTLGSGELPDVTPVDATQLKQLAESDQIMDLTQIFENYASPMLKEALLQEGPSPFDAATIDGKLMAIPAVEASIERAQFLWIRTDWLNNLGLQPPKTMDDVLAISKAFTENDPDGNNANDTFGLGVTKGLFGGMIGLEGFFAGYDAFPNIWLDDGNGGLMYGSIQPEVKKVLQVLQDMKKAGQIDPEFGIKDGGKVTEFLSAGRIGMQYGEQWNSIYPLQLNKDNDPSAQWQAFPIVTESGDLAKVPLKFSTTKFFAVKKGMAHPEALVKMFNMHMEKNWGETGDFDFYYAPPEAESVWQLSPVTPYPLKKNVTAFRDIEAARQSGDFSKLEGEARTIQDKLELFETGTEEGFALWGWERIYSSEGSMGVTDLYDRNNQFLLEKFVGAPTPTMVERNSTLKQLQEEVFVKIILGDPIDEFDKFVEDWKKLGGDDITKEVNEWYASTK